MCVAFFVAISLDRILGDAIHVHTFTHMHHCVYRNRFYVYYVRQHVYEVHFFLSLSLSSFFYVAWLGRIIQFQSFMFVVHFSHRAFFCALYMHKRYYCRHLDFSCTIPTDTAMIYNASNICVPHLAHSRQHILLTKNFRFCQLRKLFDYCQYCEIMAKHFRIGSQLLLPVKWQYVKKRKKWNAIELKKIKIPSWVFNLVRTYNMQYINRLQT